MDLSKYDGQQTVPHFVTGATASFNLYYITDSEAY